MIELLIVLVIMPLVLGAISVVIITSLENDAGVSTKLSDSHDAQITSAYFVRDVETATSVSTDPSSSLCPTNGSQAELLGLSWTQNGLPVYVSYGFTTSADSPVLVRRYCEGSSPEVDSDIVHDLFSGLSPPTISDACSSGVTSCATSGSHTDAAVTVTCLNGGNTCADSGLVTTYPASFDGVPLSPGVASVTIGVVEKNSGYQYSLSASPKDQGAQNGSGLPPGSSAPAVLLLDGGTGVLNCGGSGHGGPVTVNGNVAVNSSSAGSLALAGGDSLIASQVYSEDSSTSGSTAPVQPPSAYTSNSTQPYDSGGAYPDPFVNLPDPGPNTNPSTTGMTTYNTGSLQGPGIYTNPVAVTSSQTIPSGMYIFEGGLSVSGNPGTTLSGNGVFFFIGVPNASPSTPEPATYSVSGNAVVSISGLTTGTYSGIAIFQSRHDANTLTISGNGQNSTYGGLIYAPDATVNTSGNGATFAGSIVASALDCGGNGGLSVGFASVQTDPAQSSISLGNSNTDDVTVIGNPGRSAPTGGVTFYVCGPTASAQPCTSTATEVGSAAAPLTAGSGNTSSASSVTFTPNATGTWCFAGYYSGDGSYGASSDTSIDECFTVTGANVSGFTTLPSAPSGITLGSTESDAAMVTGTSVAAPTGTVTFYACEEATAGTPCTSQTDQLGVLSAPSSTSGNVSTYSSPAFTPTSAGTWCFDASYSGDSNYLADSAESNPASECFAVTGMTGSPPTITMVPPTSKKGTVTFSGTANGGNPVNVFICAGTVTSCDATNDIIAYRVTTTPVSGSWSVKESLVAGNYTAQAYETDSFGTGKSSAQPFKD